MKNYILKSIILILFVSLFTSCSNNDDQESFEPVTIDLIGLGLDINDTSFTQQGFNFSVFQVRSNEASIPGIALAFPNSQNDPSTLTLDLSGITGINRIITNISDFGGGELELLNNGEIIETINVNGNQPEFSDYSFTINGREIDAFRYKSLEGIIRSIRLE